MWSNYMQFPLPEGGNGAGAVPKSDPNGHAGALLVSAFGPQRITC